jgi:hypothetical protein
MALTDKSIQTEFNKAPYYYNILRIFSFKKEEEEAAAAILYFVY